MLAAPQQCEILPPPIRNKVFACLAMCFDVQKSIVQSVIKMNRPITQYGRVTRLEGGDKMVGHDFVKESEDSQGASFVQVEFMASFHMCNLRAYFFLVHPISRSTCSPLQKNTRL
jgi:hypothetical protein